MVYCTLAPTLLVAANFARTALSTVNISRLARLRTLSGQMVFKDTHIVVPEHMTLSHEKQDELTDTADRIVAETLRAYEQFVDNNRDMDRRMWKLVKSREKVHVYRTRRSGSKRLNKVEKELERPVFLSDNKMEQQQRDANMAGRPYRYTPDSEEEDEQGDDLDVLQSGTTTNSSSSGQGSYSIFPEESVLEKVKPSHIPLIVATGDIDGSIEDVAFGALAHTDEAWYERNSYVKNDNFDGRKILASFQLPTLDDPFRYVGVKWATRYIAAFSSRRDLLFVESSGIALDSDDERVYYSLAHSIEVDECPPFPSHLNIVRMNLSICFIMRQISSRTIEVYARGYTDMGGNLPATIGLNVFAQGIADVVGIVESSYLRKLCWMLVHRDASASTTAPSACCGVCGKKNKTFSTLMQTRSTCAICRDPICQKCSIQKTLLLDAHAGVERDLTFCISCVLNAQKLSAWDVAAAQRTLRK
ncbi:hypothetical protein PsorP6_011107 [Peronosclerospora sorghi]|uniref:Uncharacterized protein n=1 Tax=Peronosclerospora sorghi TaxID=230839 RepID=A0ACC0VXV7_9STRA|nr:hypothetical protein PsorP6_011107 [Peronosclerospora sorghi]